MVIKVLLTLVFLAVMIGVGLYTRKQASSVDGFPVTWITSLITPKMNRAVVDKVFECYNK